MSKTLIRQERTANVRRADVREADGRRANLSTLAQELLKIRTLGVIASGEVLGCHGGLHGKSSVVACLIQDAVSHCNHLSASTRGSANLDRVVKPADDFPLELDDSDVIAVVLVVRLVLLVDEDLVEGVVGDFCGGLRVEGADIGVRPRDVDVLDAAGLVEAVGGRQDVLARQNGAGADGLAALVVGDEQAGDVDAVLAIDRGPAHDALVDNGARAEGQGGADNQ